MPPGVYQPTTRAGGRRPEPEDRPRLRGRGLTAGRRTFGRPGQDVGVHWSRIVKTCWLPVRVVHSLRTPSPFDSACGSAP
jgi:hypothetical protein